MDTVVCSNRVSGIEVLFRYERTLPYLLSDLLFTNVYINKFINFMMRDGRKYAALKMFYSLLRFVHSFFNVDALFVICFLFSKYRIIYDVFVKKIGGNRTLVFPRIVHGSSQLFKCMHLFFLEVRKNAFDTFKYHEQVGIMLIRCFMNPFIIKKRIKEIYTLVFENRYRIPFLPRKFRVSRKSTIYYWSMSKSFYGITYRRNKTTLKRNYC